MKNMLLFFGCWLMWATSVAQTVKGKLYYDLGSGKREVGANLKIFLIPVTAENKTLISKISSPEVFCNEDLIKTARNFQLAISNPEGYFYFTKMTAGRYFLKICTYYGGTYYFTVKNNFTGTINLPDFEADPPIKPKR